MAISSPNVIQRQGNQNQLQQAARTAQSGFAGLMNRLEQQRQFDQNTQFQIMQMDADQRTMFANQNPDAFANILKGMKGVSSDEAYDIVENYATNQVSHIQQAENAMATIMEMGGYGQGQQPQPQPQPQPNPEPQPQPTPGPRARTPFTQGIDGPTAGMRWNMETGQPEPIQQGGGPRGNTVTGAPLGEMSHSQLQGLAQQARGGPYQSAEMPNRTSPDYDPNAPQNQGITGMNAARMQEAAQNAQRGQGAAEQQGNLRGGDITVQQLYDAQGAGGLIQGFHTRLTNPQENLGENVVTARDMINMGSRDINWTNFNKVVPNPDKDSVTLENGQEVPMDDWLESRNMDMEDLQRTRAFLENGLKNIIDEQTQDGGGISFENLREGDITKHFRVDPSNPQSSWMWHQGLTGDEVREIQQQDIEPVEMYRQAREIVRQREDEKIEQVKEEAIGSNPNPRVERNWDAAENLTHTMNTGQKGEFSRRSEQALDTAITTENGQIKLRDDLSEEDLRKYTQRANRAERYLADRALPKSPEAMEERGTATVRNAQAKLELLTGETGQDAFIAARNFLSEDAYLEERISLMENELALNRWATEKEISLEEASLVLRQRIFEDEQAANETAAGITNPDDARRFVGEQRKALYERLSQVEGEVNPDSLAKLYNEDVIFRSAWDTYLTSLQTYYQASGIPIEINSHEVDYDKFLGLFGGKTAQMPYIGTPMGGGQSPGQETATAYENLPASDRAIIEQFTGQNR